MKFGWASVFGNNKFEGVTLRVTGATGIGWKEVKKTFDKGIERII